MNTASNLVAMTPQEEQSLELTVEKLDIDAATLLLVASKKGLCMVTLTLPYQSEEAALEQIKKRFPKASIQTGDSGYAAAFLQCWNNQPADLVYHLKGTAFQLKVWNELLKIPYGQTTTYGTIAITIGHSGAYRAVGSAVGDNPVYYAVPCHRVLPASGKTGHYFWGSELKAFLLKKEQSE